MDEKGNVVGIVSAKVLAHGHQCVGTLAVSGALPENVNYAPSPRPSPIRWERVSAGRVRELCGIGAGRGGGTEKAKHG